MFGTSPITPSGYNSYRAQLSELLMATAQLNLDFPCCWESNLDERPDTVARLRRVDAMFTTFVSKFPPTNEGHLMYFCTIQ